MRVTRAFWAVVPTCIVTALGCDAARAGATSGMFIWDRPVNNVANPWNLESPTTDPVAGGAWSSRPWVTIDLGIQTALPVTIRGIRRGVIGFGGPGPTELFHHPLGGDARSIGLEPQFNAMPFDTFVTFGGQGTQGGPAIALDPITDLSGATQRLVFGFEAAAPITIQSGDFLWIARLSFVGVGPVINIPFMRILANFEVVMDDGRIVEVAAPTPGSGAALLLAAGVAGARRRRG